MGNGGVRGQNRRFHRRAIAVGEDPMERNLNHILVIQLNLIVTTGIEESIERRLQLGFELSDMPTILLTYCSFNTPRGL